MREIEFRGQQINTKQWVYGYLYRNKGLYMICENIRYAGEEPIFLETIGQYTGLKDKNGKKIFEGDIVKDDYCIYEVVYDGNGYYVEVVKLLKECGTDKGVLYDLSDYKDLEVIGNIYDNPELLKEEL